MAQNLTRFSLTLVLLGIMLAVPWLRPDFLPGRSSSNSSATISTTGEGLDGEDAQQQCKTDNNTALEERENAVNQREQNVQAQELELSLLQTQLAETKQQLETAQVDYQLALEQFQAEKDAFEAQVLQFQAEEDAFKEKLEQLQVDQSALNAQEEFLKTLQLQLAAQDAQLSDWEKQLHKRQHLLWWLTGLNVAGMAILFLIIFSRRCKPNTVNSSQQHMHLVQAKLKPVPAAHTFFWTIQKQAMRQAMHNKQTPS